jgi:hypothetical protein
MITAIGSDGTAEVLGPHRDFELGGGRGRIRTADQGLMRALAAQA